MMLKALEWTEIPLGDNIYRKGKETQMLSYGVWCEEEESAKETKAGQLQKERIGSMSGCATITNCLRMLVPDKIRVIPHMTFSSWLRDYSKTKADRTATILNTTHHYRKRNGNCGGL